jgi:transcription antitermination factor NusG
LEKKWYVIHTKPKCEKKVCEQVERKGIETYLPLIDTIRYWSDRKKKVKVPLFPGYVLIYGDDKERYEAISDTAGALRYVMYRKRPAVVSDDEIKNIRISMQIPEKVRIEQKNLVLGDFVEITHGVFRGLKGFITQTRGNYKLIVNITELETSFSIQLSNAEVNLIKSI